MVVITFNPRLVDSELAYVIEICGNSIALTDIFGATIIRWESSNSLVRWFHAVKMPLLVLATGALAAEDYSRLCQWFFPVCQ